MTKNLNRKMNKATIFTLLLMTTMIASCTPAKFPAGVNEFGFSFEIDWDVFESGTYTFLDQKDRRIGGARLGNKFVTPLKLDVKLKDGRQFQETIDIEGIFKKIQKNRELPDISKSKYGGSTTLEIHIGEEFELKYRIAIQVDDSGVRYKRSRHSIYKKLWEEK